MATERISIGAALSPAPLVQVESSLASRVPLALGAAIDSASTPAGNAGEEMQKDEP